MQPLAIIGDGGHSRVVQDMAYESQYGMPVAILDDKYREEIRIGPMLKGPVSALGKLLHQYPGLKLIVAIGTNEVRRAIAERLAGLGFGADRFAALRHERAAVSPSAVIGPGSVIMPGAVVNAGAHIGRHCIINSGAVIEHDCVLGNYVHAAPHATLTGAVVAGEGVFIGAGATVIPGRMIGDWTVVGAGSTVIRDIPPYGTAVGSPAKVIKHAYSV